MSQPQTATQPLTLDDLADLLSDEFDLDEGTLERFAEFARTDPRLRTLYRKLEGINRDFGHTEPTSFRAALWFDRIVDRLEQAEGWKHPDEVLGNDDSGYEEYFDVLIRMIEARAARAEKPSRLLGVKRKLVRAKRALEKRYGISLG